MYHVIVNPNARSGRGRKNWEIIRNILETNNIEYEVFFLKDTEMPANMPKNCMRITVL